MNEREAQGVGGQKNKTILDRSMPMLKSLDVLDRSVLMSNDRIFKIGQCRCSVVGCFRQTGAGVELLDVLDKLVPVLNGRIFQTGRCFLGKAGCCQDACADIE